MTDPSPNRPSFVFFGETHPIQVTYVPGEGQFVATCLVTDADGDQGLDGTTITVAMDQVPQVMESDLGTISALR